MPFVDGAQTLDGCELQIHRLFFVHAAFGVPVRVGCDNAVVEVHVDEQRAFTGMIDLVEDLLGCFEEAGRLLLETEFVPEPNAYSQQ